MLMKRIIALLFGSALLGLLPASATMITLTGAGGVTIGAGPLTPPSLVPQLSAAFDSNIPNGYSNNGLKVNGGGAVGSMEYPTTPTNSVFYTFEGSVDAMTLGTETPLGANLFLGTPNEGTPTFYMQPGIGGQSVHWWGGLTAIFPSGVSPLNLTAVGSGYNPGIYPWTASGGGCTREPSGVWAPYNNTLDFSDPGFGCNAAPTIIPALRTSRTITATIPRAGGV
jgi:hypothetical protein